MHNFTFVLHLSVGVFYIYIIIIIIIIIIVAKQTNKIHLSGKPKEADVPVSFV